MQPETKGSRTRNKEIKTLNLPHWGSQIKRDKMVWMKDLAVSSEADQR
jgi:hypothetical protein